jgi:hypothetical protein
MTATDKLGRDNVGRYVGLRQGKCWERTENSNYYCGGCGWKVTDHDSYCPECGGALHKAALDSSNCTNSERTSDEYDVCERHHYIPTVEYMLWELLEKIAPDMEDEEAVPIVKACAVKLRLAESEDA